MGRARVIQIGFVCEYVLEAPMDIRNVPRSNWKHELSEYLEPNRGRSLRQIASVVVPSLGVWVLAAIVDPSVVLAAGLGLAATVFLMRMYSFFHDLTHNSMFRSRKANARWGYLLGFLLFTPYRWWQR